MTETDTLHDYPEGWGEKPPDVRHRYRVAKMDKCDVIRELAQTCGISRPHIAQNLRREEMREVVEELRRRGIGEFSESTNSDMMGRHWSKRMMYREITERAGLEERDHTGLSHIDLCQLMYVFDTGTPDTNDWGG